jgi:hypothetical protein
MLVEVMEEEVFVDLLLSVERRRKSGTRGEVVREAECMFALLEIFKASTFNVRRVPSKLTHPVMGMAVECGNYSTDA